MKSLRLVGLVVLLIIVFGAGTGVGMFIQSQSSPPLTISQDSISEFQLVEQAWDLTRQNYVDRTATQPQPLAYGAISGMIDSLGDTGHSTFLTPDEVKQENQFEQGQLQGIGVEIQEKNGGVVIIAPIDGSPAQKAGLRPGDIIQKVNGQVVTSATQVRSLVLGSPGTSVTLTIQSPDGSTRDVTLVRAVINITSVSWNQLPGSGVVHLRISSFINGTSKELDSALAAAGAKNPSGIILDLRDNPGGLLEEAVGVTSRFISSGNVLLEKDINGKITTIPVLTGVNVTNLPVVVLINQGTASAAEIVSGALHDAGRAKLVGETTFGTGTVLTEFPLSDGSTLVLAIQEWLTPSGKTIWHTGLASDTAVALATGASPLFPESETGLSAAQIQSSGDQQLITAINILTGGK